ncbi:MAG: O-antigen ligase domain-containing protein [Bacteroidetes bacterium]|nr:MAG: O-antigen ligase domain-containing protein [Bacteroidota bacterium]
MSSTNGAGNFFAFTTLISLCQLRLTNEKKYIFFAVLFLTCVILTVSFSSFVALAVGIILFYKKQMNLKHVMVATLVLICSLSIISLSETFASIIQTRYDRQFIVSGSTWFLPANLFARLDYWRQHLEVLFSEDKLFFGFGISGIRIHLEKNLLYGHGNPESLYFRLISESGLAAVIMFVLMHRVIFKAIRALSTHRPFMTQLHLIKVILIMFLVANIGNQTMYYGGSLHLFCIMLTLIYFYEVKLSSFQIRGNARGGLRLRMQNRKPA